MADKDSADTEPLAPAAKKKNNSDKPLLVRSAARLRKRWRAWLRFVHRDAGYLVIGLTFIYALSGIAINHIDDWDANFKTGSSTHKLKTPLPTDVGDAVAEILDQLKIDKKPDRFDKISDNELEIKFKRLTVFIDLDKGEATQNWRKPRFFLRVANWLHYNRGKKAWTYVADFYAIVLLFLALSGMFMLAGRKGLLGRGGILILIGISVPVLYVTLAGGPGG